MFRAILINSMDCKIGQIDEDTDAKGHAQIAKEWLPTISTGDRIVIETTSEDDDDPMDDYNYVGSRHHY